MTYSFRDFLNERLAAFQSGDLWEATRHMLLPAPVYQGDDVEVYETQRKCVEWLKGCYSGLRDRGWSRTDLDVQQMDDTGDGGIRALVRWTSRASENEIINICDVAYFCRYSNGEGWKIAMTEIVAKWTPGRDDGAAGVASG